jgi:2-methylcitrate dehydratase PrpD
MPATRALAAYASRLKYGDLSPQVVERAKLAVLDGVGNAIGGYALGLSEAFLGLAKEVGGGREEATLIGDGSRVSVPMAAFGNGALCTMLDYCDDRGAGRSYAWLGALAVPAALAAGESRDISGRELITSVVAGYEVGSRLLHSMDMTFEQSRKVTGETISVFAAAAASGRALGLDEDGMLSTLGMTGIYTPVPAGRKWMGDEGLTPRKDIKQGWAWMCMTGAFAAVSARKGLSCVQENNVLDGDRGLWRMLGMDIFREDQLTAGLGQSYHIASFSTKLHPGCTTTHPAVVGVKGLVEAHHISPEDIQRIDVVTNRAEGVGFDDQDPTNLSEMEFSTPYQVSASLLAGEPGPDWYSQRTAGRAEVMDMTHRVFLSFDDECERAHREGGTFLTKITLITRSGQRFSTRVDRANLASSPREIKQKFVTTASQVTGREQVNRVLGMVEALDRLERVSELLDILRLPPRSA